MRLWLALLIMPLSLAAARSQNTPELRMFESLQLTPEAKAKCLSINRPECDNSSGCYFDYELTQEQERRCRSQEDLQRELQRRVRMWIVPSKQKAQ